MSRESFDPSHGEFTCFEAHPEHLLKVYAKQDALVYWEESDNQNWQQIAAEANIHFTATIQVGLLLVAQQKPSTKIPLPVTANYDYFTVMCP